MNFQTSKSMMRSLAKKDVIKIIVMVTVFFVSIQFILVTLMINSEATTFFDEMVWKKITLPSNVKQFIYQPWSLLTYMITEMKFMQIVGNMIWLWIFGMVIEDLKGEFHVLPIFIIGGIISGMFFLIGNYVAVQSPGLYYGGSLPSVTAVVVASTLYKPNYLMWELRSIRIRLWMIGVAYIIFVGISFAKLSISNTLLLSGGILTGILYNYGLENFFLACTNYLKQFFNFFSKNENFIAKNSKNNRYDVSKMNFSSKQTDEEKLNKLLEKIHEKGIHSLSNQEMKYLKEHSSFDA